MSLRSVQRGLSLNRRRNSYPQILWIRLWTFESLPAMAEVAGIDQFLGSGIDRPSRQLSEVVEDGMQVGLILRIPPGLP